MDSTISTMKDHFSQIIDPRLDRRKLHDLSEILIITICAILSGVDDWEHISEFGKSKIDWFKQFLVLKNGVPSHDTFGRVFSLLSHNDLEKYFVSWVTSASKLIDEVVAIDGKTLRGSHDRSSNQSAIHLVSAYATESGLILGQEKISDKSNEITAIPELLDRLYLTGCIVTIDAMGCQKKIVKKIIDKEADYVLSLKGNQGTLHNDVKSYFESNHKEGFKNIDHDYYETNEKNHGRLETRKHWIIKNISGLNNTDKWMGLKSIGLVESERTVGEKTSKERRFFICSIEPNAKKFANAVREHWAIENKVHWVLDVTFNEDRHRARTGNSAQNMSILRRLVINVIKQDKSKGSIKTKRLRAGWNQDFLSKLLAKLVGF
jgi:predicted transposase YbfD/YdcC